MKYSLPSAVVLILAACALVRFGEPKGESALPGPRGMVAERVQLMPSAGQPVSTLRGTGEETPPVRPSERRVPAVDVAEASVEAKKGLAEEMLEALARLELTDDQSARVLAVLQDREEELKRWHQEIRESGYFDPSEYGRRLLQRRDLWFRRVDALLDARQHGAFLDLVTAGSYFRPGTDFTVVNGELTVIR